MPGLDIYSKLLAGMLLKEHQRGLLVAELNVSGIYIYTVHTYFTRRILGLFFLFISALLCLYLHFNTQLVLQNPLQIHPTKLEA